MTGTDGALWFSILDYGQIGRITPKGAMTFFPPAHARPSDSRSGPTAPFWFTTVGDSDCGRITVDGKVARVHGQGPDPGLAVASVPTPTARCGSRSESSVHPAW